MKLRRAPFPADDVLSRWTSRLVEDVVRAHTPPDDVRLALDHFVAELKRQAPVVGHVISKMPGAPGRPSRAGPSGRRSPGRRRTCQQPPCRRAAAEDLGRPGPARKTTE